jgi:ADP-ribose pyrophosphatase YjhB (NUDIX family)
MVWKPHVTVASVIEQDGRFLLVEEDSSDGLVFNQPAGHLEPGESLLQAAVRETLEETAYHFRPESLLGVYRWQHPRKDITYLRFAFAGSVSGHEPGRELDTGIVRAAWLTLDEIRGLAQRHRSPLVLDCIEDYRAGKRYPLDILTHYD